VILSGPFSTVMPTLLTVKIRQINCKSSVITKKFHSLGERVKDFFVVKYNIALMSSNLAYNKHQTYI
jgi:hypothetical protein